jgi:hypothetical protein
VSLGSGCSTDSAASAAESVDRSGNHSAAGRRTSGGSGVPPGTGLGRRARARCRCVPDLSPTKGTVCDPAVEPGRPVPHARVLLWWERSRRGRGRGRPAYPQPKAADAAPTRPPRSAARLERQDAERAEPRGRPGRTPSARRTRPHGRRRSRRRSRRQPSAKPSHQQRKARASRSGGPGQLRRGNFKNPNAANKSTDAELLTEFGFGLEQMAAWTKLWIRESQWNPAAYNPSSGAVASRRRCR